MRWALVALLFVGGIAFGQEDEVESARGATAQTEDIRRTVRALESKNGWVSLDALDYVAYFGSAAVPALVDELASPSSNGRVLAAVALSRIPDERAVPALIAALEDTGGLALNTLSEDGESLHAVYPKPEHTVLQQAQIALVAITGKRFTKRAEWRAWWEKEGATFKVSRPEPVLEALPPQARWLKGVKIVIDPGHGGDRHKQGFKRGLTYLSEADLNLRVARYLRDLLVRAGAIVTMTRDGDKDISLADRSKLPSQVGADFFLSIHHNWSPRLDSVATTTWYHFTSPDEKPSSLDIARHVQEEVTRALEIAEPPKAGGLMSDGLMYETGFGVLRALAPDIPGALCETTYYSNFAMERRLRDPEFNKKQARGFFLGLARYMAAGVPRAEVVRATPDELVLQAKDGLEERGDWKKPFQILSQHTLVKIDGKAVPHSWDGKTGRIAVRGSFEPGKHEVDVVLVNLNANHSWPKKLSFNVPY